MGNKLPLTHPQKRIWYNEKIYPNLPVHNIGGPIRIKGSVDLDALEEAIHCLVKEHDGLRIQLQEADGACWQYVVAYQPLSLTRYDFSTETTPEIAFETWVQNEHRKVFPLLDSPLYYFALFKITARDYGYYVRFHHLIADGWSIKIMTETICNYYTRLTQGQSITTKKAESYFEFIQLETKYLNSERFQTDRTFWLNQFATIPEPIVRTSNPTNGSRYTYQLSPELSEQLRNLATQNRISLNTIFTTAFLIYWYKISQQTDMVFGIPVLNRSGKKEKSIFGMFTSTVPFRIKISDTETLLELLRRVHRELMECYFHQKYPYDRLVHDLELQQKGIDTLFQFCVNYYNTRLNTELAGCLVENTELHNGYQLYALQIVIKDWLDATSLTLDFDYQIAQFDAAQIAKLKDQICLVLKRILDQSQQRVVDLEIVNDSEKQYLLYEWNVTKADYPLTKTIQQLFEEQVRKTPGRIAVSFAADNLTYDELNRKANQLARYLRKLGVGPETVVALYASHSLATVIGIIGVLKAGGAYLPVDPNYPAERIRYMLEDSASQLILTNLAIFEQYQSYTVIDLNDQLVYQGDSDDPEPLSGPNNLAYLIYTSGSTGKPKGVMIEQQGLVNYIYWAGKVYQSQAQEVFALYSSLAFDLTVTSIFTPLISGNRIIVYHDDGSEFVLYQIMRENQVTIIKLTPSHLSLLKDLDNRNSNVKCLIVGGEDLKVNLAEAVHQSFGGAIAIYNEYGPTETVVGCMIHRFDIEKDISISVPIGLPADNVQIYLLDDQLRLRPAESSGEIYIAGDGVARGYHNQADLTRQRFLANPFQPGARMYKTGDLAKRQSDGKLVYLGRKDNQVKIRGHRIELGEIEKELLGIPSIKAACVIDRMYENGAKYLCAYLVPAAAEPATREIRKLLQTKLPDSMIPQYFVIIPELPLTVNGKINRSLLPEPDRNLQLSNSFVRFKPIEEQLVKTITEILLIDGIGLDDNFYHLGGDSIKAIQIAARLNDQGYRIKVRDILANPTIQQMAACLETVSAPKADQPEICEGTIPDTPIVAWFFEQRFPNHHHWNQSVFLKLKRPIPFSQLQLALMELVKRHDSLRINYDPQSQKLFYNNRHREAIFILQQFDLSAQEPEEQLASLQALGAKLKANQNIETSLLFQAAFFERGSHGQYLLLTAHHLIVDGVSWRIILGDLEQLLDQLAKAEPLAPPSRTESWQSWATALERYRQTERVKQEANVWQNALTSGQQWPFRQNHNGPLAPNGTKTIRRQLASTETKAFQTSANQAYHTEPHELVTMAVALAVRDCSGQTEFVLELEGHGRSEIEQVDITKTVGWFTALYPVSFKTTKQALGDNIKSLKEQLRTVPERGFNFGVLKYLNQAFPQMASSQIRLNYLGDFTNIQTSRFFELQLDIDTGTDQALSNPMTVPISLEMMVLDERLTVVMQYQSGRLFEDDMVNFVNSILKSLKDLIEHCLEKQNGTFTPSDFDTITISQDELDQIF